MSNDIKRITVIEALNPFVASESNPNPKKKKVAAYARVSTDEEDQENSFDNQVSEYKNRIYNNDQWKFAGMYADKGISGTQIRRRESFIKMIEDAKAGKIDLILTKSISRFGRNTVEIIQTVRDLREIDVAVYFEKENIYSDDPKLDFFLAVMSSIAQEESRSMSESIKWSYRKRFKEGRILLNPKTTLGYGKDDDGNIYIIPEEGRAIEMMFNFFLQGHTPHDIANILMKEKIKTVKGNDKWNAQSVLRILQNEKYAGNALLQKTVTVDYLTHKRVENDNIETQYFVENSHPGIVSNETFELVQTKIQSMYSNRKSKKMTNSKYPLTGLVYCSLCKRPMKRHIHNHKRPTEKVVLNCNHAPQLRIYCKNGVVLSDFVELAAVDVIKRYSKAVGIDEIIANEITSASNYDDVKKQMEILNKKVIKKKVELDKFIKENLTGSTIEDNSFNFEYTKLKNELQDLNNQLKEINDESLKFYAETTKFKIMKEIFEGRETLSNSLVIKSMIKLILVDKEGDLLIVMNVGNITQEDILSNLSNQEDTQEDTFSNLSNLEDTQEDILSILSFYDDIQVLYEETLHDEKLNANIRYKVVVINE